MYCYKICGAYISCHTLLYSARGRDAWKVKVGIHVLKLEPAYVVCLPTLPSMLQYLCPGHIVQET